MTEHEQLGMEAWLEAYHYTTLGPKAIDFGHLEARAGSIQVTILYSFYGYSLKIYLIINSCFY